MDKPNLPKRKTIRIKGYDYSTSGYYFITICTKDKKCILSKVVSSNNSAQTQLTQTGQLVENCLYKLSKIYTCVKLHDFVIMPNHVHAVIEIDNISEQLHRAQVCAPTMTLGQIVRGLKAGVSKYVGNSIWQRNYYEHVIRNEKEYLRILEYINNNPLNWALDEYYN